MSFYDKKIDLCFSELNTSVEGLAANQVEERLAHYGENAIKDKGGTSPIILFLQQFNSPVVWVLIGAAIISAMLGEIIDLYVILVILIVNAIIGFLQEYKAEKAIEALKKLASAKAKVIRDGEQIEIDAITLVPGDILVIHPGDKVPADARLIETTHLKVQEAALTGESVPVEKSTNVLTGKLQLGDQKNMIFSSTLVTEGKALAVVTATGMQSEIGKIANLIQTAQTQETPLQAQLKKLGSLITKITLGVCFILFGLLFLRSLHEITSLLGYLSSEAFVVALETAAALAVAAIPEGLPVVVTVSLAIGVKRMIKKHALVRKLPSVETLGSTSVICTDKTGTLTKNEMTVTKLFVDNKIINVTGTGYDPTGKFSDTPKDLELLLKIGLLNNDAKHDDTNVIMGDPTEAALLVSAKKFGLTMQLHDKHPREDEILFDSTRKRMTTLHTFGKKKFVLMKGAPDVVLGLCTQIMINGKKARLTPKMKKEILAANEQFSSQALRVLGFAIKEHTGKFDEKSMVFVGLQGMIDPPREEARLAIARCKTAGIKVVMITGDYKGTAVAIGRALGLEGRAIDGKELDTIDLDKEVEHIDIYARVNPEHKMKIVDALKKKGHIVAMTGDGVNDAPALKSADIGVAMGITGTDVAKESADMILTDDNFASIVNAVEEGRGVYDNIRKYFAFLISGNIGEIFIIFLAILFGLPAPLTATQILLINLVTDGLPAVALSADPYEPNALSRKPRNKKQQIHEGLKAYIIYYPIIMTLVSLGVFYYYYMQGHLVKAQTATFLTIGFFELYQAISCRSLRYPVFKVGVFKNKYLLLAIISSLVISIAFTEIDFFAAILGMHPLSLLEVGILVLLSSSGGIMIEVNKWLQNRSVAVSAQQI